ncbi:MAG: 6-bladed beta-propeller [Paludibacter sp.]
MKTNTINICILVLLLTLNGCRKEKNNGICINIEQRDEVSMSDIFSKIEIVRLETNDKSLIKEILKIIVFDNKYFIFDFPKSEILVFNAHGSYLTKISNRGNGPDQYINISDFDINFINKKLSLLSSVDRTMHEYDLNGNYLKRYKLPDITGAYKSLKYLNNDTIVYWTFDFDNRIKFYSVSRNKIISETFPEQDIFFNKFLPTEFPYENYVCRSSQNMVFKISPKCKIENGYEWNFGRLNNNVNQIQSSINMTMRPEIMEYVKKIYASENINYIFNLQGGNSIYLYAQITRKNKLINIFYNKKTKKNYVFENSIEGAKFYPIYWNDNYVVGIHLDYRKSLDETIPDMILDKENIKKKNQISEFDNPILIKYYFK